MSDDVRMIGGEEVSEEVYRRATDEGSGGEARDIGEISLADLHAAPIGMRVRFDDEEYVRVDMDGEPWWKEVGNTLWLPSLDFDWGHVRRVAFVPTATGMTLQELRGHVAASEELTAAFLAVDEDLRHFHREVKSGAWAARLRAKEAADSRRRKVAQRQASAR